MTPSSRGLTLVEILVALAITAIVTAILYGSFDSISRTSSAIEEYSSKLREIVFFMDTLEKDISGAFFSSRAGFTHFELYEKDMAGTTGSELSFTTFNTSFLEIIDLSTDIVEVKYESELAEDGESIIITRTVHLNPQIPSSEFSIKSPVLSGIRSFELEAIDDSGDEKKTWNSGETLKLPSKIRVKIELTDGYSLSRDIPIPLTGDAGEFINSGGRIGQ